jgi:hypothetical protein
MNRSTGQTKKGRASDKPFLGAHLLVTACVLVFQGADEPSADCEGTVMAKLYICDGSKVVWSIAPVIYAATMSGFSEEIERKTNPEIP